MTFLRDQTQNAEIEETRLTLLAETLASGILRLKASTKKTAISDSESEISLDLQAKRSVHGHKEKR